MRRDDSSPTVVLSSGIISVLQPLVDTPPPHTFAPPVQSLMLREEYQPLRCRTRVITGSRLVPVFSCHLTTVMLGREVSTWNSNEIAAISYSSRIRLQILLPDELSEWIEESGILFSLFSSFLIGRYMYSIDFLIRFLLAAKKGVSQAAHFREVLKFNYLSDRLICLFVSFFRFGCFFFPRLLFC